MNCTRCRIYPCQCLAGRDVVAEHAAATALKLAAARRIMERAASWFDIQSVAHRGELGAKAASIRDSMRVWLAP